MQMERNSERKVPHQVKWEATEDQPAEPDGEQILQQGIRSERSSHIGMTGWRREEGAS